MKKNSCFVVLLFIFLIACKSNIQPFQIGLFDISKDDKNILFSFSKNGKISILSVDLEGDNLKEVIKSTPDSNYYNPQFSPDGSKILFMGTKRINSLGCSMFLANKDGSNKLEILKDDGEIIEAVFSDCEDKIYYIKSKEFGNYSPLGRAQPHNSDVYAISLVDYKVEQITHKGSYNMYRISEYDCNKITLNMSVYNGSGLFMFPKENPDNMTNINPLSIPRVENSFYETPFYSQKYKMMGFIAPYELYVMSMIDRGAKLVLHDDDMIKYYRFYNSEKKIVYTNENKLSFYIVDFKGTEIKEIDIGSLFVN